MAFRSGFRSLSLHRRRLFSTSILSPDSKTPLSGIEKSRAALSLLRFEKNPERILDICRAAALTPELKLDRIAYSVAISKLKESNYYEGIRGLIRDSLDQPHFTTERIVSHFIVLYGQCGLVDDAIKLFDEMPALGIKHSVKALNKLLFACILAGDYGSMKRIFSEFPRKYGLDPDLETYNTLLKGFSESGSANSSHSILAEMDRKGVKPNATTLSIVISGFYKEEKFGDAEKMMGLMKKHGVKPGIGVYNVKMQSLCKLGKSAEAKALLDDLLARGMKPNRVTFGHLIYGFCREGNLDVAKALFEEMNGRKLKPEAGCYFTLVYYLCQGRDFDTALEVCKKCLAKSWIPNITTMKLLVNGLTSIGKVDEAKEIIGVVKEKFSRNSEKWSEIEEGLSK
ncbi:pentatricopeptide repeat-containing protein At1g61870, mitochondrial-like [Andrographis paniculata]|uniref:pentatricopeptide repeat-containing protein At1g61870, mitochondrial-like n=1 Tax=Andrographis paniculata TaxID=175694 RepID=UPI0021E85DC4|nr:pentatricopeptide repeat-containing protein At1g61870, mitochondrial-like [Andrographis paniculata]